MIIGLSGKARSGKDTFGEMLAEALYKRVHTPYVMMAYAYELKLAVQKHFDLSYSQLWGDKKEVEDKRYPKGDGFWTGREMLQEYGQFFRSIDNDFWTKKLFNIIEDKEYKNVIVTDLRHPNEVDAVVSRGGYHVKVVRDDKHDIHNDQHISETALDNDYKVDALVLNNGTLEELKEKADGVVQTIITIEALRKSVKEH